MAEFNVGDVVRVTRSNPNQTSYWKGYQFTVGGTYKKNGFTYVIPEGKSDSIYSRVTATNLQMVCPAPPRPEIKPFAKATKEELAKQIVYVAEKYARENGWCDTVNDALREAGLGDFVPNYTKKVRIVIEAEVDGDEDWTDEDYFTEAEGEISVYLGEIVSTSFA